MPSQKLQLRYVVSRLRVALRPTAPRESLPRALAILTNTQGPSPNYGSLLITAPPHALDGLRPRQEGPLALVALAPAGRPSPSPHC
jgi:hypothetical protein